MDSLKDTVSDSYGEESKFSQSLDDLNTNNISGDNNNKFNIISTGNDVNSSSIGENEFDTDDDYDLSDDSDILNAISDNMSDFHLKYSSAMVDNSEYLVDTLNEVLDSVKLDKSVAIQTKTSGQLNHKNQKILDKLKELEEKQLNLKKLYDKNFEVSFDKNLNKNISRIELLKLNISELEHRIEKLTYGQSSNSRNIFRFKQKQQPGVLNTFPIEFNQAKDKVLERLLG